MSAVPADPLVAKYDIAGLYELPDCAVLGKPSR